MIIIRDRKLLAFDRGRLVEKRKITIYFSTLSYPYRAKDMKTKEYDIPENKMNEILKKRKDIKYWKA